MKTTYVVVYDYGYEGYSEPKAIFTSHRKMMNEYPSILSLEDVNRLYNKKNYNYDGYVYFIFGDK